MKSFTLLITLLVVILCLTVRGYAQDALRTPVTPLPANAPNFSMSNDCNMTIINPKLLEKIHGNKSGDLITANLIITVHEKTVLSQGCGGTGTLGYDWTPYFLTNLCDAVLAKMAGTGDHMGIDTYEPAVLFASGMKEYATNPQGVHPTLPRQQLLQYLGLHPVSSVATTPEKCGTLTTVGSGVGAYYRHVADMLYYIATDCSSVRSLYPDWTKRRIAMIVSPQDPLTVFGTSQGDSQVTVQWQQCRGKLNEEYERLLGVSTKAAVKGAHEYYASVTNAYMNTYAGGVIDRLRQHFVQMNVGMDGAYTSVPTTRTCEMNG